MNLTNASHSNRQFDDLLSLLDTDEVIVKEIDVESSLQDAAQNLCPAVEVINIESVEPTPYIISKIVYQLRM